MTERKSPESNDEFAVRTRGNGFYYAIRRFVGAAISRRQKARTQRLSAGELARLTPYLQRDIDWPPRVDHNKR